jgi:hypothetical protein
MHSPSVALAMPWLLFVCIRCDLLHMQKIKFVLSIPFFFCRVHDFPTASWLPVALHFIHDSPIELTEWQQRRGTKKYIERISLKTNWLSISFDVRNSESRGPRQSRRVILSLLPSR